MVNLPGIISPRGVVQRSVATDPICTTLAVAGSRADFELSAAVAVRGRVKLPCEVALSRSVACSARS